MKEKAELILNGGEKRLSSILPVVDDFERAIKTMAGIKSAKKRAAPKPLDSGAES